MSRDAPRRPPAAPRLPRECAPEAPPGPERVPETPLEESVRRYCESVPVKGA